MRTLILLAVAAQLAGCAAIEESIRQDEADRAHRQQTINAIPYADRLECQQRALAVRASSPQSVLGLEAQGNANRMMNMCLDMMIAKHGG